MEHVANLPNCSMYLMILISIGTREDDQMCSAEQAFQFPFKRLFLTSGVHIASGQYTLMMFCISLLTWGLGVAHSLCFVVLMNVLLC